MEYRMTAKTGTKAKPISKEAEKIVELANTRLRQQHPYKGRYIVRIFLDDIKEVVGESKAQEAIVEALAKGRDISFTAGGSTWLLFSSVFFDGAFLKLEYWPGAVSMLKALSMEVRE